MVQWAFHLWRLGNRLAGRHSHDDGRKKRPTARRTAFDHSIRERPHPRRVKLGRQKYPAWYHNLRAQPQCQVTYRNETRAFRARAAQGAEYARAWEHAVNLYKGYAEYQKRTGGRPIPILLLESLSK